MCVLYTLLQCSLVAFNCCIHCFSYHGGRGGIVASQGVRGKRGVGRGRGAGRGRGIGRGRGRGNAVVVSREQLDEDLDSYMSQGDF